MSERWTLEDVDNYRARLRDLRPRDHMRLTGIGKIPKYRNVKTEVDGIKFDSKKEAARYQELKTLEKAGEINGLTLQPKYELKVNGEKICYYIGDFGYIENGSVVIEDVKGVRTHAYRIKSKLMRAIYGITIRET